MGLRTVVSKGRYDAGKGRTISGFWHEIVKTEQKISEDKEK